MYICNNGENAKEMPLDSTDEAHILQGLYLLRKEKVIAFTTVRDAYAAHVPPMESFTERDFGIPQIDKLITYLEGE